MDRGLALVEHLEQPRRDRDLNGKQMGGTHGPFIGRRWPKLKGLAALRSIKAEVNA
jgi:hypothetical protein